MKEGWATAIGATSREDFFSIAREADPKSYVIMYEKLVKATALMCDLHKLVVGELPE